MQHLSRISIKKRKRKGESMKILSVTDLYMLGLLAFAFGVLICAIFLLWVLKLQSYKHRPDDDYYQFAYARPRLMSIDNRRVISFDYERLMQLLPYYMQDDLLECLTREGTSDYMIDKAQVGE